MRRPVRWLRTHARHVLRIARWEVTKNAGGVDRRTVGIALVAVLGVGILAPLAAGGGVTLDQDIYRVGVESESPLYDPVALDPTFQVQRPSSAAVAAGSQEVVVRGPQVREFSETTKGRAAVAELRSTVQAYNDRLMTREENQTAAFPVVVNVTYAEQATVQVIRPQDTGTELGSDQGAGDGSGDGTAGGGDGSGDGTGDGTAGDGGGDGTAGDGGGDGSGDGSVETSSGGGLGGSGFGARLTGGSVSGSPSDISPPFPFRSLVLAFVYVLPLNFIIQAYGSTMLSERLNRRGELLLVAPVSRGDIIVGKTLPYFAGAIAVASLITLGFQGTPVSVLAVAPLALLFLGSTFLGAMFARSFKELTFVTVTITVSLTSYAFVPAIFTDVLPIALISPLTLVVRDLQGQAISLGQFAFSTLPPTLTAVVLFGLGSGLYREEDMFTQRPIPLKVLDSLAGPIKRRRSVGLVTAALIPFIFVAELVAVAFLYPLAQAEAVPLEVVLLGAFVSVAVIEEIGKSLHVYAGYAHAKFDDSIRTALVLGAFSGLGFFAAEKLALIAQFVGLGDLSVGRAQLGGQAALNSSLPLPVVVVALLFAPLALHVVTASISALGARRGRYSYVAAILVAIVVHLAYNLTVVSTYV